MAEDTVTKEKTSDAIRVLALDMQQECRGIASLADAIDRVIDRAGLSCEVEEHVLQYLRFLENAAATCREKAEAVERTVSKLA